MPGLFGCWCSSAVYEPPVPRDRRMEDEQRRQYYEEQQLKTKPEPEPARDWGQRAGAAPSDDEEEEEEEEEEQPVNMLDLESIAVTEKGASEDEQLAREKLARQRELERERLEQERLQHELNRPVRVHAEPEPLPEVESAVTDDDTPSEQPYHDDEDYDDDELVVKVVPAPPKSAGQQGAAVYDDDEPMSDPDPEPLAELGETNVSMQSSAPRSWVVQILREVRRLFRRLAREEQEREEEEGLEPTPHSTRGAVLKGDVADGISHDEHLSAFFDAQDVNVHKILRDFTEPDITAEEFIRHFLGSSYPVLAADLRNMHTMFLSMDKDHDGRVNKADYFDTLARGDQLFGYEIFGKRHLLFRSVEQCSNDEQLSWLGFLAWLVESFVHQYQAALSNVFQNCRRRGRNDADARALQDALLSDYKLEEYLIQPNSKEVTSSYARFFDERGDDPVTWHEFKDHFFRDATVIN